MSRTFCMAATLTLLVGVPVSHAATLQRSTTPIAGHAAGSFGLNDDMEKLSGGAAWAADGSTVFTLDTTHELKRWRAADGALLGGVRLELPKSFPAEAGFPNAAFSLSGTANAYGLPVVARGWKNDGGAMTGVVRRYRLNTVTKRQTPVADCLPVSQNAQASDIQASSRQVRSRQTGLTCTADGGARAWLEGGEVRWQRGDHGVRLPVPGALQLEPAAFTFGLSEDGQKLALLALRGENVTFGGAGELLTWEQNNGGVEARRVVLGGPLLHAGASLNWVGGQVLVAANVYNTGDEYGSGGSRVGQWLALVDPEHGPLWSLPTAANLRGAHPSPDGRLFVTVREGSVPELRRVSDGGFVRALGAAVHDAVPLAGGEALLAVQGSAGFGRVVRHSAGRLKTLFKGAFVPYVLAVNADSSRIAVAGGEGRRELRLLDASGRVLRDWQARERVRDLAFSPDGRVLSASLGFYGGESQAWRVLDGTSYPLPEGAQFPITEVILRKEGGRQNGNYRSRRLVSERATGRMLWRTPWHSARFGAVASRGGRWLAQTGFTANTVDSPEAGREVSAVNLFSRVRAHTGESGPVLSVPVAHPDDPYASWSIAAFDGRLALLQETTGDGCGGQMYGYQLADLATGSLLGTPARLQTGYATSTGCGYDAPLPEATFAPDGRLLLRVGNRLDWWTLGEE